MPVCQIKHIPVGSRLTEDVYTPLGGLLFTKGTVVEDREIEILDAFMIEEVSVEAIVDGTVITEGFADGKKQVSTEGKGASKPIRKRQSEPGIMEHLEKAVSSFKNLFQHVQGGQSIPVLEVRNVMTSLIKEVEEQSNLLFILKKADNPNNYLYEHCVGVGLLSYIMAKWMKLPEKEWMQVALAGMLMDIGKTKIDPKILWKPDKLTSSEFEEMKKHTVYGYELIKSAKGLTQGVGLAALQHHEREDGSGYPFGIKGDKIHTYSKIITVADMYHAMCSDRLHQKATSPFLVVEQLLQDSFGKLDPKVVRVFVNGITQFSIGSKVELSDGTVGKVVFINQNYPTRPMVEINQNIINLADKRNVWIVKALV
ncbi:HD-GYP domain-containing protein [Brevibacillus laterosporus]|uniref:HD-GYP domain-containing protein n=1 Tax=Brevibacillus laterosporus TaxID=1465 RepID=UPI002406A758|nr:HD-GYP domain-containing protein [Brevibacillus laterosporus]MDF9410459.1 HD-GYP domain-containing protein [Brevibacillus laterosporus]